MVGFQAATYPLSCLSFNLRLIHWKSRSDKLLSRSPSCFCPEGFNRALFLTDTYLKGEDSSQDSLCHFEYSISFSELITLPIRAASPYQVELLCLNVCLCAGRQGRNRHV